MLFLCEDVVFPSSRDRPDLPIDVLGENELDVRHNIRLNIAG